MPKRPSPSSQSQSQSDSKGKRRRTKVDDSDDSAGDENENCLGSDNRSIQPMSGSIRRITICNFMCHNRLEVKFGNHINFIVGQNGSGKSAVMAALVVGLGGKARATSRGTAIESFVKIGKRSAWVEISLRNKGNDSYKPQLYGDNIIVRRNFTVDGCSSYVLYSASGEHVSSSRDELLRIIDHFNIQVDNPISILNQDTSRNFLNTKSPGDKFKFFMKATQLAQMRSDYDEIKRTVECTRLIIKNKEQPLSLLKNEVKAWKTKWKNLTFVSKLKERITELKHMTAWAIISQKERDLKPKEKALSAEEESLPKFTQKMEQAKSSLEEKKKAHLLVEEKLIDCVKELKDLEPVIKERAAELRRAKEQLKPLVVQEKACCRELATTVKECKQCEERIEELKAMASHDYEAERKQRETQIAELEQTLQDLTSQRRVAEHEVEQYRSAIAKYKSDIAALETQLKTKYSSCKDIRETLQTLGNARNSRLHRFGHWVPAILNKIKANEHRFHKLPKGPLGACFELTEPKWALAVECCLKSLVTSFVCHNFHDEKILMEICNQECPRNQRPIIITGAFSERIHNISQQRVMSDRFLSLVDIIKYTDPVVINTLIDQRGIENVLLIEDSNEAREVMMHRPPKNSKECFTAGGDQLLCNRTFRYYSTDKTSVRYLMADVGEQIAKLQKGLSQVETDIKDLTQKRESLRRETATNQQEERKSLTHINKLGESQTRISLEMEELKSVEDVMPVDVETLEEEVSSFKSKIKELTQKRSEIDKEKKRMEEELNDATKKHSEVEMKKRDISDGGSALKEEINKAQTEVDRAKYEYKHYSDKLKEQECKFHALKTELERCKEELEQDRLKALEICPQMEVQQSVKSIEKEITEIKRRIEEKEQEDGNAQEITETYQQKKSVFQTLQTEVHQHKQYIEKLDEVMKRRNKAFKKLQKVIASRTKYFFLLQMHQRSYTGKINFDFEKQTLDILVSTSQESGPGSRPTMEGVKDLKSLSGGERSYSTVCFILALWEAMESPFRCLDEFDVFMDMVNRQISVKMMMETAEMHKEMQFIFVTPQDMSSMKSSGNVKIFRMPDPERSQKTVS